MEQTLDISWQTISKVFIAGFVLYIFYLARDIVVLFFFALIISLLLDPAIEFLRKLRIPRIFAVTFVYLSLLALLGLIIYLTAPLFIFEIIQLSQNIPDYFERLNPILKSLGIEFAESYKDFTTNLISLLEESSASVFKAITSFFGGIYSTFVIFTLAFFISLEKKGPGVFLALLTPKKYEHYIITLFERAKSKVAGWFGARILSCVLVGVTSFIVFILFGIKFSFILALMSGLLNFVPYVGPLITLILTVLFVGVSHSWMIAWYIFIALLVIQEIENKFVTPLLMKKFINLPPVLVLMSLLIGGTIFGFFGTLFAVPVFGIIYEFSKEFLERRKEEENNLP